MYVPNALFVPCTADVTVSVRSVFKPFQPMVEPVNLADGRRGRGNSVTVMTSHGSVEVTENVRPVWKQTADP